MTGLLIDVEQSKVQIVTDASSLQDYYKLLNCDLIDIVRRRIGGRHYNIICDEEGSFPAVRTRHFRRSFEGQLHTVGI